MRIKRPVVTVGGELTLEMLDLSFNHISKFYEAPLQLKANGGVFLVDDFGRQRMRPADLLNRWIVPLESRVDYLTLHTGKKFQVPFDVLIVFATNLDPESLADEAFLRRIPVQDLREDPTPEEFSQIFDLNCRVASWCSIRSMVEYLLGVTTSRAIGDARLPAARPVEQVVDLCRYRGQRAGDQPRAAGQGLRQLLPRRTGEQIRRARAKRPARPRTPKAAAAQETVEWPA